MAKKANSLTPHELRRFYEILKNEEQKLEKSYAKWSIHEKIDFISKVNIAELDSLLKQFETTTDCFVTTQLEQLDRKDLSDEGSLRMKDIDRLKELGFVVGYDQEERSTFAPPLYDECGVPLFFSSRQIYYKDIYFIHPEKAIYLGLEHVFVDYKYDMRTSVSGYAEIMRKSCEADIKNGTFQDWSIDVLENDILGVPIYSSNFNKILEYLENNQICDFSHPLPAAHLPLEIETQGRFINQLQNYCERLISNMPPSYQQYFDNQPYQKKKKYRDIYSFQSSKETH